MNEYERICDEMIEEDLKKLNKFSKIKDFDILYEILLELRDSPQFIGMGQIPKTGYNKEGSKWKFDESKIPFINAAKNGLSNFALFYYPPLTKVIIFKFFTTLYSLIQLNYIYSSNEKLDDEDYKSIILGNVGAYLTYFVEEFENPNSIPEHSKEFFTRLTNVKYENKEVHKFLDEIYNVISDFTTCSHAHINYCRTIGFSALYLCACSALKQDRDVITYEDVIKGHLALFKLFQTDIRPLVKRGYANYRGFYYKNKKAGYPKRILWVDYYSTEK